MSYKVHKIEYGAFLQIMLYELNLYDRCFFFTFLFITDGYAVGHLTGLVRKLLSTIRHIVKGEIIK